jgi:hypothetical protein
VANGNYGFKGQSFVTTTPALAQMTLADFLHGQQKVSPPKATPPSGRSPTKAHGSHRSSSSSAASIGLYPTPSAEQNEVVKAAINVPFRVLYPSLETAPAVQQTVRAYTLQDSANHLRHAYVVVWQQNGLGGYYNLEGSDWLNPPVVAHPTETRKIGGVAYRIFADGSHIHMVAWRQGQVLYWLTNTLLEDLTNEQMLGIARSAQSLH